MKITEDELVLSAIGNYIEAEGTPLSRFGWRIPIAHPGRPHLLKVTYPDDRRRFMTVGDGTTYDASFGIVTGFRWPLSPGICRK
ncbi:MAG: hypothetical protein IKB22_00745 [Lentisphaeria bacterium]|nr:hypothetical protein [Lentisphaeria bacterium]